MKRLSTKAISSLLKVTVNARQNVGQHAEERHFERLLRRHDRKGELRAGILGIDAMVFRELQRRVAFDEIIHLYGFKTQYEFKVALIGKLRDELLRRGWSSRRIDAFAASSPVAV